MAGTVDAQALKGLQEGGFTPHAVAEQIALAMHEHGGMMEVQHLGVDPATVREAFESARDLFALSEARKRELPVYLDQPLDARTGFRAAFTESLGPRTKCDAREGFVIHVKGREAGTDAVQFRGDVSGTPPRFQAAAKQLLAETLDAAQRLVKATSVALDLAGPEKDFFDGMMAADDNQYMGFNYYPAVAPGEEGFSTGDDPADTVRFSEHTDFGLFTLLFVEEEDCGLQVQGRDGAWRDVKARPGSVIVNTGDLLSIFTNGRWEPAKHRVVVPAGSEARPRYSIGIFTAPDREARVRPLRRMVSAGTPARWPSMPVLDYYDHRIRNLDPAKRAQSGSSGQVAEVVKAVGV